MIQNSINQLLTTAGLAVRLSPLQQMAENRSEAQNLLGRAKSAQSGISAIKKGLSEENKNLTETELNDIQSRLSSLNKDIYSAKIGAKPGHPLSRYLQKGVSQLPRQEEYNKDITEIEKLIQQRRGETWQEKALQKKLAEQNTQQFRESLILGSDERRIKVPMEVKDDNTKSTSNYVFN